MELCEFQSKELLFEGIEIIKKREMIEDRNLGNQDKILIGHISIADTLVKLMPETKPVL